VVRDLRIYGSVGGRVFLGKFEVFGEGVEEG